MIRATKKWLSIKITSGILIPFMVWFIINLVSLLDANNSQLVSFFQTLTNKIILIFNFT